MKASHIGSDFDHLASAGVAQGGMGVELFHDRPVGLDRALRPEGVEDLLELLRPCLSLADQPHACGFDGAPLGPGAHQGVTIADENRAWQQGWHWKLQHLHDPVLEFLRELFHSHRKLLVKLEIVHGYYIYQNNQTIRITCNLS
jgi:hypothetical protein